MTEQTYTPDWVKNAIFYQIFPDRFAKSDSLEKPTYIEPWDAPPTRLGFKGGDLLESMKNWITCRTLGSMRFISTRSSCPLSTIAITHTTTGMWTRS